MDNDTSYDDLATLFAEEDKALAPPDEFVKTVMMPIYKRSRWRQLLLFGAGGVGLGAAGSQIVGSLDGALRAIDLEMSTPSFEMPVADMSTISPTVLLMTGMVVFCLAMMAFLERA